VRYSSKGSSDPLNVSTDSGFNDTISPDYIRIVARKQTKKSSADARPNARARNGDKDSGSITQSGAKQEKNMTAVRKTPATVNKTETKISSRGKSISHETVLATIAGRRLDNLDLTFF